MRVKPLGNRVLVRRLRVDEETRESGIVIPDKGQIATYKNEVLEIGPEVKYPVEVGSVVITTPFVGDGVKVDQETHYLLEETDLLAVVV